MNELIPFIIEYVYPAIMPGTRDYQHYLYRLDYLNTAFEQDEGRGASGWVQDVLSLVPPIEDPVERTLRFRKILTYLRSLDQYAVEAKIQAFNPQNQDPGS